jgi:hypothetical protein
MKKTNVRIISGGLASNTEVLVDGVKMSGVRKIEIPPLLPFQPLIARIEVVMPELDVITEAEIVGAE